MSSVAGHPADPTRQSPGKARAWILLCAGLVCVVVLMATAWRFRMEKSVTRLVMPSSLLWFGMLGVCVASWRRGSRGTAVLVGSLFLFYTLAGNVWVAKGLCRWLERNYAVVDPRSAGPFDAVFVLGGGTDPSAVGHVQLNASGDRVLSGVRYFLAGRTRFLCCNGEGLSGAIPAALDITHRSVVLFPEMGVDLRSVRMFRGENTRQEIDSIRELAAEQGWTRLGLVTSAWHMRRVMRLAAAAGLEIQPLPADFRGHTPGWLNLTFLPEPGAFEETELALRELLAWCVNR